MNIHAAQQFLDSADDLSQANILRPLRLGPELHVLEISCSSGILSRHLGEHGHQVTSIKTCQECLAAARLRCADLSNVSFAADAEEIASAFAQNYDLILLMPPLPELLISVLNNENGKEKNSAAEEMAACLRALKNHLAEKGLLIIGTGNRLGLKYWLGASEEHYGKAYVGLWGYGSSAQRPRLFCRNEWLDILRQADIHEHSFLYPFPDHQRTDLILSEDFIRTDPHAYSLLYRIRSRDTVAPDWMPDQDEFLYWRSLHQSGCLADFANSFFIIAAKERNVHADIFPYDFIRLSRNQQQSIYRTFTYKERNQSLVIKKNIDERKRKRNNDTAISHIPSSSVYINGPLLSELWLDAIILKGVMSDNFKELLKEYYEFIKIKLSESFNPEKYLDLLPFNIIRDAADSRYHFFDQEWIFKLSDISADFVLFRSLLWFGFAHDIHISCRMEEENLTTLAEFIQFGFQLLALDHQALLPGFIELEGQVQHSIDQSQGSDQVRAVLYQPFQHAVRTYQNTLLKTELFWVAGDAPLSAGNSISIRARAGQTQQTLLFVLPGKIEDLKILRFDPGDKPGFLHLHRLTLRQSGGETEGDRILWEAVGSGRIAETTILENLHHCPSAIGDVFMSVGNDPQVIIELPEQVAKQSGQGRLLFEAVMDWPQSSDYLAALDEMKTLRRLMTQMKEEHFFVRRELEQERRRLEENAAAMRERIVAIEHKLDVIRRTWIGKITRKMKLIPCDF